MSVIVKGVKIPSECEYCGFCRYYRENGNVWCNATNKLLKLNWKNPDWTHLDVKKPQWCPLIGLPSEHGRLIDENDVIDAIHERLHVLQSHSEYKNKHGDIDLLGVLPYIAKIKPVIEAEGES